MKEKLFMLVFALIGVVSQAQNKQVYETDKGAINGYDPVAYFTESKPVEGNKKFSYKYNEATWYFASKENLESFKANPEKFAPQFGGYCAYGTSQGHKAPTEAEAWTIVDNKLYLNYNKNVKKLWSKNQEALIKQANDMWPKIKDSKPE